MSPVFPTRAYSATTEKRSSDRQRVLATPASVNYGRVMNRHAAFCALLSAALFGGSTPAAKALLGSIDPAVLAGLLYCGAGLGVAMLRRLAKPLLQARGAGEAPVSRADAPWLAGAILAGGIAGPLLLMTGLARTDASTASLLLTLEGAATATIAWFGFHEHVNRRVAAGMVCLLFGALVLAWMGYPTWTGIAGPLAITGACVAWGIDNNLTRKISLADPLQIVELKGLIAGPVNLALGLWVGGALPSIGPLFVAGIVGFAGYGLSLALFVLGLRHLGAARTGAYFSTAPFLGALASIALLHDPVTVQLLAAGALMALGVWLHLSELHEHEHEHRPTEHAHPHTHDEHHQHGHGDGAPSGEPHTHAHRHEPFRHSHPHAPDMHHTHLH